MIPTRILVLGSGGREHALAWRLARDPHAPRVWVAPGNDAMAREFTRLQLHESDADAVIRACHEHAIELVVIGPEAPLAAGVADALRAAGIAVFGASAAAARLEASKAFAKDVMREAGVPTAAALACTSAAEAHAELRRMRAPYVLKADGLAAGKGVLVTRDLAEAEAFATECLSGAKFGASGSTLVLEEFLEGEELSIMAICDGARFVLLTPARDHKRAFDDDAGPNTGGMGAFAPVPGADAALEREVGERVVAPMLRTMAARGTPYQGALYVGLMLGPHGPRVVEFNARFGDPETQVILPLTGGSLTALLASAAAGALEVGAVTRNAGAAVAVALVDEGYPGKLAGDGRIEGLEGLASETRFVFHAGTRAAEGGWSITGGRAAYVTALGADVSEARTRVYDAIAQLGGGGWRMRRDIARSGVATAGPSRT